MATSIRRVDYVNVTVKDRPGEAYRLLAGLADEGVNLLAFNAVPIGPVHTQLVLFPEDLEGLARVASRIGLVLTEPHHALLIQGDDELGALAEVHGRLSDNGINVFASTGVADGRGGYGYIVYVRPDDLEAATSTLGI